jgi:hypothetical protein
MCEGEIEVLEDNSTSSVLSLVLYQHTVVHVHLEAHSETAPRYAPLSNLKDNQSISVCVYKGSRKMDGFMYELLVMHVLDVLGIRRYMLSIQVFEDVSDLCLLKNLICAIECRYKAGLELVCGEALSLIFNSQVIYTSEIH